MTAPLAVPSLTLAQRRDPGYCAGSANGCRWCQLIGALAFGEERPGLLVASAATDLVEQASAQLAAPASSTESHGAPLLLDAQGRHTNVAPPTGSEAASSAPTLLAKHPKAPDWWIGVEVPQYPKASRRMDDDFMEAMRYLVRVPLPDRIQEYFRAEVADCQWFIRDRRIDFAFWSAFDFDEIWSAICVVAGQPHVANVYLGTSQSAAWRWRRCRGHNNMVDHSEHYDQMYILTASWGTNVLGMERLVQKKMLQHFRAKCAFSDSWRPGPIKRNTCCVIYLCIKLQPGSVVV